jgi:hypothetical protein
VPQRIRSPWRSANVCGMGQGRACFSPVQRTGCWRVGAATVLQAPHPFPPSWGLLDSMGGDPLWRRNSRPWPMGYPQLTEISTLLGSGNFPELTDGLTSRKVTGK